MNAARLLGLLALLVGACGTDHPCRPGTLFLDVTLDGAAAAADTLAITVQIDGGVIRRGSLRRAGAASTGGVEVGFDGGYPTGGSVAVTVTAWANGLTVGEGKEVVPLAPGCTPIVVKVLPVGADAGADAATPTDLLAALDAVDGAPLDLAGVDLVAAELGAADLAPADLAPGAELGGPDLAPADLASPDLATAAADLSTADLMPAPPVATLTGIVVFSANSDGSYGFGQGMNTNANVDGWAKLSVYDSGFQDTTSTPLTKERTSTCCWPNEYDTPALSLPLSPGTYTFTLVGSGWNGDGGASHFGVSLFFGGSTSNPGITAFSSYSASNTQVGYGVLAADTSSNTPSLVIASNGSAVPATGAGLSFGRITLTSFTWFNPATGVNGGTDGPSPPFSTAYRPVGEMQLVVSGP